MKRKNTRAVEKVSEEDESSCSEHQSDRDFIDNRDMEDIPLIEPPKVAFSTFLKRQPVKKRSILQKQFEYVGTQIQLRTPSLKAIFSDDILDSDRTLLYQLYCVYTNDINNNLSLEKIELQEKYFQALQKAKENFTHCISKNEQEMLKKLEVGISSYEIPRKILGLTSSDANKQIIYREYQRFLNMPAHNDEYPKLKTWLDWALSMPYDKITQKETNCTELLRHLRTQLDEELYGMSKVKEQIILFVNSRLTNPAMKTYSLGLLGPPGCGKTSIIRLLAASLQIPLEQISLGGIQNADYLKGHSYTYISSEPGEIAKSLSRMGVKNGILFFDEYDKISEHKDVCSSLLHITDASQNSKFQDNYLNELRMDLSHLWLVYSMNNRPTDTALDNRIFYIELEEYTHDDKVEILRNYILKKACKNIGWKDTDIIMSKSIAEYIVEMDTKDKGVRNLTHIMSSILDKIYFLHTNQNVNNMSFAISRPVNLPFTLTKKDIDIFTA